MGGRADAVADAMAHEASKPRAKLHKEKPVPASEGSSRQQGGLDVVDHVQALHPVHVAPRPEQVAPPPEQPVVNVDGDDDGEEVLPPLPPPVVVADENEEEANFFNMA
uniref:Uncharacterized protein n=1 Tax=Aegilops tauschii TaxID=37682 RepID=M8C5P4_AEGTA